jgi:hypothetical protein
LKRELRKFLFLPYSTYKIALFRSPETSVRPPVVAVGDQEVDCGLICCYQIFCGILANFQSKFPARIFASFRGGAGKLGTVKGEPQ